jgi:hypothetical protein
MTLPRCEKCGATFEPFDGLRVCISCQPKRGSEHQIDVTEYMSNGRIGYRLTAGFRMLLGISR